MTRVISGVAYRLFWIALAAIRWTRIMLPFLTSPLSNSGLSCLTAIASRACTPSETVTRHRIWSPVPMALAWRICRIGEVDQTGSSGPVEDAIWSQTLVVSWGIPFMVVGIKRGSAL